MSTSPTSDIAIGPEEVAVGSRRVIGKRGWRIRYRVDPDDAGFPSLEFYATHRMTDDRHRRIWADGHVERLEVREAYGFDPKVPGSQERARAEYFTRNQAIASHLRDRGLYPEGDINAFLHTVDIDADEGPGESGGSSEGGGLSS